MQVLPKQLIALIVKMEDQIVLILNHQGPALALHLQRKHVATETTERKYSKSWEKDYSWLYYDEDREGAFCKVCQQFGTSSHVQHSGGALSPSRTGRKLLKNLKLMREVTLFLTKEYVAHSTSKFEKLVDVVVRCGSQHLKQFLETAPRNAVL